MQVWVIACGHTVSIAAGSPFRPSHTTMQMSWVPRFLISVKIRSQNFDPSPSPCSPAHSPSTSRVPSTVTPSAT